MNCLHQAGSEILVYKGLLTEVARESVDRCFSKRGYKWSGKLLRHLLGNLTATYPLEMRGVNPERWNDPGKIRSSLF